MGIFGSIRLLIDLIRRLFDGSEPCEQRPAPDACEIGWQPSVLTPVFYGVRDIEATGEEASVPGACRIFFPSIDGAVFDAPLLEGCGRYPLVLFCHGMCELDTEHYKKWFEIPASDTRWRPTRPAMQWSPAHPPLPPPLGRPLRSPGPRSVAPSVIRNRRPAHPACREHR